MVSTKASSNTPLQTWFLSVAIPPTPGNIEKFMQIEELISLFRHQTLDLLKLTLLYKTLKAARLAIADRVILNCTNTELLATNTQKKQRAKCTGIQYNSQSTCVVSLDNVEEKRQLAENKRKDKEAKKLA